MDIIHSMDDEINNIITMGPKDHQSMIIMKGKRTKRPRQPSPASTVFTASSCSSGGDGGGGRKLHTKIPSSESLCSEILSSSTDEDEDMANCLILLAHSGRQNKMSITPNHINNNNNNNIAKQEGGEITKSDKNISKKFKEITTTSSTLGGKDGTCVYECKTCNRSFASFQALGGHRTSHKKHKPTVEIEEKKAKNINDHHINQEKNQHEEDERRIKHFKISNNIVINKVKIHECSICGAEFASGQALGGHMRRHRTTPTNATTTTTTTATEDGERRRNILEVDLNLPAPPEDDDLFQFSLFSSPSLVDCQY